MIAVAVTTLLLLLSTPCVVDAAFVPPSVGFAGPVPPSPLGGADLTGTVKPLPLAVPKVSPFANVGPSARPPQLGPIPSRQWTADSCLLASTSDEDNNAGETVGDAIFDGQTTLALIGGQSLLIAGAVVASIILSTPNYGLGQNFHLDQASVVWGALGTLPLFGLALVLDQVEDRFQPLKDVNRATQRSVLALLGGERRLLLAATTALALGTVAGVGEEMLFRGVLQYELASRFGNVVGVGVSSVVFGALHAVTPLYAILAVVASVFFGTLYNASGNLAVPMVCHGLYDLGALIWAHWVTTGMTAEEQAEILDWGGPGRRGKDIDVL